MQISLQCDIIISKIIFVEKYRVIDINVEYTGGILHQYLSNKNIFLICNIYNLQ